MMRPRNVFADRILTNDLLFKMIFDNSSPQTLLRLSRTCRRARIDVNWYISRRFNVNRHISPYISDFAAFRSLQARTGTLISGSTALQFFTEKSYSKADLDLYVYQEHKETVCRFFMADGYTYKPSFYQNKDFEEAIMKDIDPSLSDDMPYGLEGIACVFTFTKEIEPTAVDVAETESTASSEGDAVDEEDTEENTEEAVGTLSGIVSKQVQVIVAWRAPMEVILNFHSTVVMNVIAWDRAYCLYPRGTLIARRSVYTRSSRNDDEGAISKYERRGWHFIYEDNISESTGDHSWLPLDSRWIGDGHSWTVKLPTEGITPPPINHRSLALTRDPCAGTTWKLCMVLEESPTPRFYSSDYEDDDEEEEEPEMEEHLRMKFHVRPYKGLKHKYVTFFTDAQEKTDYMRNAVITILRGQGKAALLQPSVQYYDENLMQYIAFHLEHRQEWKRWLLA